MLNEEKELAILGDIAYKIEALEQQNADLLAALKAVEWTNLEWGGNIEVCPWCVNGKIRGHHVDCQRQQAIADVEGVEC